MHILAIIWHPNARWDALSPERKAIYLRSLDDYINQGRAAGAIVLGWSKIDQSLPRAAKEGYIGIFGVSSAAQVHEFEKVVQAANWYEYFDSTNISIAPEGATEPEPHKIYAKLLGVPLK